MGPRKAKQEVKFQKPTFYSIVYTAVPGTSFTNLLPPKKAACKVPYRCIEHSVTVIACMSKQILALFQLKSSKGAIFTKKRSERRKKRAFPKSAKKGEKMGKHLWEIMDAGPGISFCMKMVIFMTTIQHFGGRTF